MPRRNYLLIFAAVVASIVCYRAADRNPLGRSFAEVADLIDRHYVGHVDRNALWSAAVRGMLTELGDPYSEYFAPKAAAEFEELLNQEFGGIGIYVDVDPQSKRPVVISPIVGSPAYRAGLLAGDVITKIDGQSTAGMKFADATALIRGKVGAPVQLTVERPGKTDPIQLPPMERDVINVDSVLGDTRTADGHWNFMVQHDPKIGYVRITSFGERTAGELKTALGQLQSQGVQGLVLDLRDDPGGLLPAAIDVCNLFLPQGKPIVSLRGRDAAEQRRYTATGGDKFLDLPVVVLVDHGSASAAEIVAACLQDDGRAKIIGQRSYGKGTVQNFIPLNADEGVLKLTTAGYWRPNGHNIHRIAGAKETDEWGVTPDAGLEVKMSDDDFQKWVSWRRDRDKLLPQKDSGANSPGVADQTNFTDDLPLTKALEQLAAEIK
jgi:carboxyl-terminal processing protease